MTDHPPPVADAVASDSAGQQAANHGAEPEGNPQRAGWRWWFGLFAQPLLLLVAGAILLTGLGMAQRLGLLSTSGPGDGASSVGGEPVQYICPMMCTPPQTEPGRCPVCAMELVPASSGGGSSDRVSVEIDPVARRVANIQTAIVRSRTATRAVRAVGVLSYDEGTRTTIAAYVDGRLERLYANYTGVVVKTGDPLALLYSPALYSGQVELLAARATGPDTRSTRLQAALSGNDLYASARQRLVELGMTDDQITQLEESGRADSRLTLCAPSGGTVIVKEAVEGQYVKTGQAIFQLADLSTVWLRLELFPEDAACIHYGQRVEATVESLPGQTFSGRVAFVDPSVNPRTRTVGVRVVLPNVTGLLRVGDFARATLDVPVTSTPDRQPAIYDPELAGKWVSPRHPHVIESSPGDCPVCGMPLIRASELGFTAQKSLANGALMVPRDAVLVAGGNSLVYVETRAGRFELRPVTLGPNCGDEVVVVEGVAAGEVVAVRGNFLIDSQMQLAGNPSLIDPTRAGPGSTLPATDADLSPEMLAALAGLSPEDRALAQRQRVCPVADFPLGSMGPPKKVDVNGTPVFICCEGCRGSLLAEPDKYLAKLNAVVEPDQPEDQSWELPPIGELSAVQVHEGLPPIAAPQPLVGETDDVPSTHSEPAGPVAGRAPEVVR